MMSKIVLFVCLVLGTVYANTQISLVNAQYGGSISPNILADVNDFLNVTTVQPSGSFYGKPVEIPATDYLTLPAYSFVIGVPLNIGVIDREVVFGALPPYTPDASVENITFVENQSYSFVFIAQSDEGLGTAVTIPITLLAFEERPNPSPFGKALLRIANIAVSTSGDSDPMVVNVTGTGVAAQLVTVPFGAASEFIEYDSAVALTLEFTLPLESGSNQRSISVTTVVNSTVVVYIRGDIGDGNQLGSLSRTIDFAFPAAPTPVAPPTAEPVSEPMADTPTAPAAAPTTVPAARTPTKRVSSAAQTVAQVAGVAALVSLLF